MADQIRMIATPILWLSITAAPTIACLLRWALPQPSARRRAHVVIGAGALLLASIVFGILGVRFYLRQSNVFWIIICYALYCYLAFSLLALPWKRLRWFIFALACTPIAIVSVLNVVAGLGIMWIIDDELAPLREERVDGEFLCQVEEFGSAMTDSGYSVNLYAWWPFFPLMQRRVATFVVDYNSGDNNLSCQQALDKYRLAAKD